MTRAFDHINATAHLLLVEEMPDHFPRLIQRWDRTGGTTMPSGPLVDQYSLTSEYRPYSIENGQMVVKSVLRYRTEVQWAKHVPTLMKLIDPQQIWHRSRDIAIAIDALRINEMNYRLARVKEWHDDYKKLALSDSKSHEVSQIIREETKRALHLNFDWIRKYIRKHIRSSLGGGGYKWRQALDMPRSEWKAVLDIIKTNAETMDDHPDWYVSNFPQTGERARSNEIKQVKRNYENEIERTRVITFGNWMSLWTVFIPDKASWYQRTLQKVMDAIDLSGECHFPFMEGGKIYRRFSDMHRTNKPYHAYDGRTWDAGAGIILGEWCNCYLAPIGGIAQIASGQSHTSMLDTIASLCATRKLTGTKIILGDDIAHYGTDTIRTPVIEMDKLDTKFKFNLGVSYWHDPEVPRITGFKITKDRGKDMISMQTQEFMERTAAYGGKHPQQQRVLHAGLYLGRFGKGTLLERIEHILPGEFMSPSVLLEEIIETGTADAFEWAKARGITEIFT